MNVTRGLNQKLHRAGSNQRAAAFLEIRRKAVSI
jgi:hypothetical protein